MIRPVKIVKTLYYANGHERVIKTLNNNDPARRIVYEEISGKGTKYRLHEFIAFETGIQLKDSVKLGLISLSSQGLLGLQAGYESNGANMRSDKEYTIRSAFGHDALCQLVEACLIDSDFMPLINDLYKTWCQEDGMPDKEAKRDRFLLKKYWQGWFRPYK